jgi:hypothetical protein
MLSLTHHSIDNPVLTYTAVSKSPPRRRRHALGRVLIGSMSTKIGSFMHSAG